jgi:hypothetical protein
MYMYMGRVTYVCTTCSEHLTRKYSAKRHNITVHHNSGGETVPLVEYLVRRSSGKYQASDPSWYRRRNKRIHGFGPTATAAAVTDYVALRPRELQGEYQHQLEEHEGYQQQAFSPSKPPPGAPAFQNVSPDQISQPMNRADDEETTTTLSQETILKIQELKRLLNTYPIHFNPDAVIKCVIYFSINGDNTILDEKLEQLRTINSAMGYPRM